MTRVLLVVALLICAGFLGFLASYDKSIGNNSDNQAVLYGLIGVAVIIAVYAGFSQSQKSAAYVSGAFLLAVISVPILAFSANQRAYNQSPERQAIRAAQRNVKCVVEKLGIRLNTAPYVRVRINLMRLGSLNAAYATQEIESYLGIEIREDCQFVISRPNGGRLPPPGTPFPQIEFKRPASPGYDGEDGDGR